MGVKRPSRSIDPETIERAKGLRLAGATMREIAEEVGVSRAALGERFAADPDLAAPPAAVDAETAETAMKVARSGDAAMVIMEGILLDFAKRLRGKPGAKGMGARELREVRSTFVELRKLTELLRGRPTARTEVMKRDLMPNNVDEAEMNRLRQLWGQPGVIQ